MTTQTPESNETNNQEEEDRGYGTVTSISPLIELKNIGRYNAHTGEQVWRPREDLMSGQHSFARKSVRGFPENVEKFRMLTSLDDLRSLRLWRAVAAEIIGTLILVLVGCGSCIQNWSSGNTVSAIHNGTEIKVTYNYSPTDIVQIALAFGLSVATVVWIIGHISGGHINPAVTCAMLVTRRISLARAFLFIVAQLLGAIAGAGILRAVTPGELQGSLGLTSLGPGVDGLMGVGVEFCVTFVLVLTVFAACDKARKDLGGSFPLTIGLSVTMCHLFAIRFTGSSMNTARSFGPAVVMGLWKDHWVYWVGPLLGGIVAGLLYDNVFAANASLAKCTGCLLASKYDHEEFPPKKFKIKILEEEDDDNNRLRESVAPLAKKEQNVV
ncbi:hypothetical protein CHS0354_023396 [Potamilus streckersoni]|uniref:Uncharacterized protein n=1 Tax=Potamilus streckersoni TaxID=2493646 RepID=A0AAE0TC09_9BIVA|nr:hypothetical protein CHS0354_023396 [Potamilus streckersoni]